jgi:hypothetical protein
MDLAVGFGYTFYSSLGYNGTIDYSPTPPQIVLHLSFNPLEDEADQTASILGSRFARTTTRDFPVCFWHTNAL